MFNAEEEMKNQKIDKNKIGDKDEK